MNSHNCCGLCRVDIKDLSVVSEKDILLENINMTLNCGQLTALVGKNGAGKTTLIRSILGERSYSGNISFMSHNDGNFKRPTIGYVPQHLFFDKSTPVSVADFCLAGVEKRPLWLGTKKDKLKNLKNRLEALECAHL